MSQRKSRLCQWVVRSVVVIGLAIVAEQGIAGAPCVSMGGVCQTSSDCCAKRNLTCQSVSPGLSQCKINTGGLKQR